MGPGFFNILHPTDPNRTRTLHACAKVQEDGGRGFYDRIEFYPGDEWCLMLNDRSLDQDGAVYVPIEHCPFCGVNLNYFGIDP